MEYADVIVGGGGIIGLSTALELARAGFRVRVIERNRAMGEASWAAAGMLAAEDPENPPELAPLASFSRDLYPEYLSTVERLSGRIVPLRTRSALQTSQPGGGFHASPTKTRSPITREEARQRIPGLEPRGRSLLWLEEASLDPRDLCAALPLAAVAAGVLIEEGTEVLAVEAGAGQVKIATSKGAMRAGAFVNCCGAWAAAVECPPQTPSARTRAGTVGPRKGQMAVVRLEGESQLQYVLRTPTVYMVPRGDGRIVVGATLESVGFDRQVDPAAVEALLRRAAELWPPIASAPVVERWAGLRPGTGDGLPLLGSAGAPNCWLATGHFRNGILLAPATGRVIRRLLTGEPPEVALDRFAADGISGSRG